MEHLSLDMESMSVTDESICRDCHEQTRMCDICSQYVCQSCRESVSGMTFVDCSNCGKTYCSGNDACYGKWVVKREGTIKIEIFTCKPCVKLGT